jgi:hypothetical protein
MKAGGVIVEDGKREEVVSVEVKKSFGRQL